MRIFLDFCLVLKGLGHSLIKTCFKYLKTHIKYDNSCDFDGEILFIN